MVAKDRRTTLLWTSVISDLTLRTLQASLWGLDARRRAAENNIANVETPGFRASSVSFEDSLRRAVGRNAPSSVNVETQTSIAPTRLNGNNVRIADEMTGLTDTALRQQMVVQSMNAKYALLRTAIGN